MAVQTLFDFTANFTTSTLTITSGTLATLVTGSPIFLSTTGSLPAGLIVNNVYYIIIVSPSTFRLASSIANALASINVTFSNNGTPTNTLNYTAYPLGYYEGERAHAMTINELPSHTHSASTSTSGTVTIPTFANGQVAGRIGQGQSTLTNVVLPLTVSSSTSIGSTGNGLPFNVMNPVTYRNMLIKL